MNSQDLNLQIEALTVLEREIERLSNELELIYTNYSSLLDSPAIVTIPSQVYDQYTNQYKNHNLALIRILIQKLHEHDIQWVKRNIQTLHDTITASGTSTSSNKVNIFREGTERIKKKIEKIESDNRLKILLKKKADDSVPQNERQYLFYNSKER